MTRAKETALELALRRLAEEHPARFARLLEEEQTHKHNAAEWNRLAKKLRQRAEL